MIYVRELKEEELTELKYMTHHAIVRVSQRAQMVLLSAQRRAVPDLAMIFDLHPNSVRFWLRRFDRDGSRGLYDAPRSGRPHNMADRSELFRTLEALLDNEAAGNPMSDEKWVRSSGTHLSRALKEKGFDVGRTTVYGLIRQLGYSLRINLKKKKAYKSDNPQVSEQFDYIALQKKTFGEEGLPIISVDTKKKELIGNFQKKGKVWRKEPEEVNYYDFTSLAVCRAIPYGIYDVTQNKGYVYVGTSGDTAEFAADALARWWKDEGCFIYPHKNRLLILADGGGCNGCHSRAWKQQIQTKLCDQLGLITTICHYPPGCSKWNPVERLLFSRISINWAGVPLRTLEILLAYIRGTSTTTGLTVKAFLQEGDYQIGQRVTKAEMERLCLRTHEVCPDWNYTISPRTE
jgi:transposase